MNLTQESILTTIGLVKLDLVTLEQLQDSSKPVVENVEK